jgi:hypothetical protein
VGLLPGPNLDPIDKFFAAASDGQLYEFDGASWSLYARGRAVGPSSLVPSDARWVGLVMPGESKLFLTSNSGHIFELRAGPQAWLWGDHIY